MESFTILVGTVGNGLWRSHDGGQTFGYAAGVGGLDGMVRGFAVDPFDPGHVLVGVGFPDFGLFESVDGGARWLRVDGFPNVEVWRMTFDPQVRGRYFVGTRPAALHRTDDAGATFERLDVTFADTCPGVGIPRITSITIPSTESEVVLVTAEVDGVRLSRDGGSSWSVVMDRLETPFPNANVYGDIGRIDCHHSAVSLGSPNRFLVSTPDGVYASDDAGMSWADVPVRQSFPQQYHRELVVKLDDPDVIFQGTGEWVCGQEGALQVSRDRGATWSTVDLPDECNSPVWCFAQHPANPDRIFACTHKGMLFGTEDGGHTWRKLRREFSEVRAMAWTPATRS